MGKFLLRKKVRVRMAETSCRCLLQVLVSPYVGKAEFSSSLTNTAFPSFFHCVSDQMYCQMNRLIFVLLAICLAEYRVAGFSPRTLFSPCTTTSSRRRVCSTTAITLRPSTSYHRNSIYSAIQPRKSTHVRSSSDESETSQDTQIDQNSDLVAKQGSIPQGYMSSSLSTMEDSKKGRVIAYIVIALLPCLGLIPFVMNRDFTPPVELMSN